MTPASPPPEAPPAPRASGPIKLLVLAAAVGFFALLGLRVQERLRDQATIARTRDETKQQNAAADKALPRVVVTRAEPGRWQPSVPLEGTLLPWHEADLGFKASGRLLAVQAKVGDQVKLGAVLATLDTAEASASRRAAEAQLRVAQAQLALAQDAERRTTELHTAGAVGEAVGVQAKGQLSLVLAQVEGAKAQLALASAAVSNHTLVAPFAGLVTRAPTGPGAVVGAGAPLVHVQDVSRLRLSATVSETDAPLVRTGAEVVLSGGKARGKVIAVLRSVDPATRRVPLEAEFANPPGEPLLAGVFVRAAIVGGDELPVLRLPATARRPGSQDEVVLVQNGKLALRRVSFVTAPDGALLVRSGLSPTDDVVASPPAEIKEGEQVEIGAAAPAAAGSAKEPPR